MPPYAELDATTNFSFLRGASHPDELVYTAALLGYRAMAVTDVNSVINSDLVRFYTEYAYWRGMASTLMEQGTYIVPVPGLTRLSAKSITPLWG